MAKSKRIHFKCPPHLLQHLNQQAKTYCGNNRSEYLRYLILQDMRPGGRPAGIPPRNPKNDGEVVIPTASHGTNVLQELQTNPLFLKQQAEWVFKPPYFSTSFWVISNGLKLIRMLRLLKSVHLG